ncbi:hypothetical protein JRQ81_018870 [Phrynocephalus forsythii]|uniref:Uncharacterized protein n=1 Tax=Phrynocephalus forsythii TaxID=171643 RepID=A0A9Q0XPC3_9SAUR|nr:hypothetical protein JRQ81_018870 [Phrynocephalus forsythii]
MAFPIIFLSFLSFVFFFFFLALLSGIASVIVASFLSLYYNVINAWAFWYLFHSFQDPLPWAYCPLNSSRTSYVEECEKATPTQYFWYRKTLNISPSIEESGSIQWEQAACLILAWLVVYLCILRGTEHTGKVVYVTATLPYLVLTIYLIRGLTLHGAMNGLTYMFTPKLEQLANIKTWVNAATQIFFSLGLGFGSLIAFASYNEPNNNCEKHAIIVSLINSATSIFASIAVQGTGLAFIVYSEAIKNMEASQLYSVLYFIMLLMLGIGSLLGNTAAILTPLTDSKFLTSHVPREVLSGGVCFISCIIGLAFTMEAGNYWFNIFNDYAATLSLLLIVLVETIAVCYVYGLKRFQKVLGAMTGHEPSWYWKIMWAFVSPVLIVSLFIFYITDYIRAGTLQYQAWDATEGQMVTKDYPSGALAVIGLLVAASTLCIPLGALLTFIRERAHR